MRRLLLVLIAATIATAAEAAPDLGAWRVGPTASGGRCEAKLDMPTAFLLLQRNRGTLVLAIGLKTYDEDPPHQQDNTMSVNGMTAEPFGDIWAGPVIGGGLEGRLLEQFRSAETIHAHIPQGDYDFEVHGAGAALEALMACETAAGH